MKKDKIHTPRVSVVIPMYNCEEFVQGVLRMFSDQRFTDYEVICIVDGATVVSNFFRKFICHRFRIVYPAIS